LIALVALDSAVWGQSSGWRVGSPAYNFELWGEPATVRYLRELESRGSANVSAGGATQGRDGVDAGAQQNGGGPYRILTEDQPFDPSLPVPPNTPGGRWVPELQPDIYEMYGVENAAGYDGFGLSRYSRLAGDMKVWGELTDPERTLRGASRELDLLNVRYLLTRPIAGAATSDSAPNSSAANPPSAANGPSTWNPPGAKAPTSSDANASPSASPLTAPVAAPDFPAATERFGGQGFAANDLGLPGVGAGARLTFAVPPVEADGVALLTSLSWSIEVPDGAVVARVRLFTEGGKSFDFDLRAGEHASDWAYDRPDIRAQVKHRRAPVATSYAVEDARGVYEAHAYVCSFRLPERAVVTGGEIEVARQARAPDLTLDVKRVSLFDESDGRAFPLRREWLKKESAPAQATPGQTTSARKAGAARTQEQATRGQGQTTRSPGQAPAQAQAQAQTEVRTQPQAQTQARPAARWRRLATLGEVAVFENTRALPRAWLASEARVLSGEAMLGVIRTGRLPEGGAWEPERTALVEAPLDFPSNAAADPSARAEVTRREPNRVELKTSSSAPSILVLSENHYPGWRAYVDGRAQETLRVDYNLRGVVLAAGEHRVEFVYRPKSVLVGLAVSLLTLASLLLWSSRAATEALARRLRRLRGARRRGGEAATVREEA
jgi:cell division septation protein DedD